MVVSRKQSTPNFPKNEHFLPIFLACFVFLKHPFWDSPFCLITNDITINCSEHINFVNQTWSFRRSFWRDIKCIAKMRFFQTLSLTVITITYYHYWALSILRLLIKRYTTRSWTPSFQRSYVIPKLKWIFIYAGSHYLTKRVANVLRLVNTIVKDVWLLKLRKV